MNLKLRNLFFWLVNFVMFIVKYETLWVIWYHLYNLNKVKNTNGGVLLLLTVQALACNFTKSNTHPWAFFTFFKNFTNGTKSRKASSFSNFVSH